MRLRMRITTLLLFWSIMLIHVFGQSPGAEKSYFKGSIDQMRQQAKTLQKPYILFFHAEWSAPSRDVELNCIKNLQIQDFLQREFLVYKVDMDSRATNAPANQLAQSYKVALYPTFIFFAPDGLILKKLAGQLNVQSFGEELTAIRKMSADRTESDLNGDLGEESKDGSWIPKDFFEDDQGGSTAKNDDKKEEDMDWSIFIKDEKAQPKSTTSSNSTSTPTRPKIAITKTSAPPSKSKGSETLEGPSEMFAIQLGAYTKKYYAQKQLDEVLSESNFPAEIRETYVNGVKYFKVLIGPYASQTRAEQQRMQVVRRLGSSRSFIVKIPRY